MAYVLLLLQQVAWAGVISHQVLLTAETLEVECREP